MNISNIVLIVQIIWLNHSPTFNRVTKTMVSACQQFHLLCSSLLGHKEFRFLLPVLPLTMHLCGTYLHYITDTCHDDGDGDGDGLSRRPEAPQRRRHYSSGVCSWKVFLVISLVLTNLPIAMYTSLLHQRGTVDVTRFLHDQGGLETKDRRMSVFFLMPCHSTPYYR